MSKSAGVKIVRVTIFYFAEGGGDTKNGRKRRFLLKSPLLDIFVRKHFLGVVSSERARPEDSKNVVVFEI